ncbi:MAG: hypothetical protein JNN20_12815 [Betaproteobacteria bacterium]|nr:hypothetical protein [Betaproteobacteria bacterium]
MTFPERIAATFLKRERPVTVLAPNIQIESGDGSAEAFLGLDWQEISWELWEKNSDAFYQFSPAAFIYYLPSILSLSSQDLARWFWPADCLLELLNHSPMVENWSSFTTARLIGLSSAEYDLMKEWVLLLADSKAYGKDKALEFAFDTLEILQAETAKVREITTSSQKVPGSN